MPFIMLNISEAFYSLQGEGPTMGKPAFFVRLQGCNLMCGGVGGKLVKEGKATWWCDTEAVWRKGEMWYNEQLEEEMKKQGALDLILNGRASIVWTGGEPMMEKNRNSIAHFLDYMNWRHNGNAIFNEIETNATIYNSSFLRTYIYQINASPKLSNSGMSKEKRYCCTVIESIIDFPNSCFKFVVSSEKDVEEITDDFVLRYNRRLVEKIYLMPGVDKFCDLQERTQFVWKMCEKYGYKMSNRLHILAWDQTTGV